MRIRDVKENKKRFLPLLLLEGGVQLVDMVYLQRPLSMGIRTNHGQLKFGEKIELPNTQTPKHANLRRFDRIRRRVV